MDIELGLLSYEDIPLLRNVIEDDNQLYSPEHIRAYLDIKGNLGFTAKQDGNIIGLIYCYSLHDLDGRVMMYLYSVGIHSAYQNRGYGSALVRYVIDYALASGYAECYVNTHKTNLRACKLYEKAGMQCQGDDDVSFIVEFDNKSEGK